MSRDPYYETYPPLIDQYSHNPYPREKRTDGFAIASLVCSLVSICGTAWPVLPILGVVFGYISLKRINEKPHELGGKGMAKAGLIIGIISFCLFLVFIGIYILFVIFMAGAGY